MKRKSHNWQQSFKCTAVLQIISPIQLYINPSGIRSGLISEFDKSETLFIVCFAIGESIIFFFRLAIIRTRIRSNQ
ncbi:hypothetical protein L1887_38316 [Cichorium endivia]|nr:hypothetical protein L1887_38316 [Cichorium endivia]